jgi:hypothetical protein
MVFFCERLSRHGQLTEGRALATAAIEHAKCVGDGCAIVDLLRAKGAGLLYGQANGD